MTVISETSGSEIERLLVAMRPKLHRYCARMVGSVIDGEDVLQDALIKAVEAHPSAGPIGNPEGWLFKIAHNTALDFLRRKRRLPSRAGRSPRLPCAPSCACRWRNAQA
jgi:RNA polymerase sigma-70 factor, ECF subfamily